LIGIITGFVNPNPSKVNNKFGNLVITMWSTAAYEAVLHYHNHFNRGDQDVLIHPLTFSYNILKFDPFALITLILLLPLPLELKARYLPSGDQDGVS